MSSISKAKVLNSLGLISLVLLVIRFLSPIWFYGLVLVSIGIGLREFYGLLAKQGVSCSRTTGTLIGLTFGIVFAVSSEIPQSTPLVVQFSSVSLILVIAVLWFSAIALPSQDPSRVIGSLSGTLFGVLYVGYMASFLIALRGLPNGVAYASFVFIVTWAGDAGAYGIGSFVKNGHVGFPSINAKKTLEGSLAGVTLAVIFAYLTKVILFPDEETVHFLILGVLLGVAGQIGDLVESLFKRGANVKDTGSLLPLHGGVLDRIDGLLFSAPLLYFYALLILLPD